jgi:hypothetical protein
MPKSKPKATFCSQQEALGGMAEEECLTPLPG